MLGPSNPPARTPPQIGEHNLRVILEAIRRDGPLTRAELALRSGLTSAGITNILRNLREDGVVSSHRRATTGGGPPVAEFALVPDAAFGIGVAIYGHYGEAVLLSLGGAVIERRRFIVEPETTEAVIRAIRELDPTGTRRVLGVGIGAAQPETLSIEALRAALPHLSVSIEQDCVAALYTERVLGVGAVETGMMLIVIGDCIRAGYMFRGKPFSGVHNRAGRIGSMLTGPDRVPLDSVASLEKLRAVLSEEQRNELRAEGSLDFTPEVLEWIRVCGRTSPRCDHRQCRFPGARRRPRRRRSAGRPHRRTHPAIAEGTQQHHDPPGHLAMVVADRAHELSRRRHSRGCGAYAVFSMSCCPLRGFRSDGQCALVLRRCQSSAVRPCSAPACTPVPTAAAAASGSFRGANTRRNGGSHVPVSWTGRRHP